MFPAPRALEPDAMNLFCRLLGHTWVPTSETPKTSWNVDKSGLLLVPTPAGEPRFYEQCARCKARREVAPAKRTQRQG